MTDVERHIVIDQVRLEFHRALRQQLQAMMMFTSCLVAIIGVAVWAIAVLVR